MIRHTQSLLPDLLTSRVFRFLPVQPLPSAGGLSFLLLLVWGMLAAPRLAPAVELARPVLSPHLPPAATVAAPVGRLPGDRQLHLAIGLPLRQPAALTNFLRELYDPTQPRYHQYLSAAEFAAAFGPTAEDYQALVDFAGAHGLTVIGVHANRMVLDVSGAAADIERALHLSLNLYRHPVEDRLFYAPDAEPALDLAVPVLHISGLSDLTRPQPASLWAQPLDAEGGGGGIPQGGSGFLGTYVGNDFRAAYTADVAGTGLGQVLGLVEFDGYYPSDIAAYCAMAKLPPVPLTNVYLDGYTGTPIGLGNREVALDIEMANSLAPGLAGILVYQAGTNGSAEDVLNRMATDNSARQLSSSWGLIMTPTIDQIFQQFAAQGQSFFTASGDGGAATVLPLPPADDPYITSVGGTTLTTAGVGGPWAAETTWNWFTTRLGTNASAGGVSPTYPLPAWQAAVPSFATNGGSTTLRNFPDVAMVADDILIVAGNGHYLQIGGTSASAPLWAAFTALVNQQAAAFGQPPVGFLNPALYTIGLGAGYGTNFHDITTGNNTNRTSAGRFFAGPGCDLCTGWGSPTGQSLIDTLAPPPAAPPAPAIPPGQVSVTAGNVSLWFNSGLRVRYTLQYKNSLGDPAWTALSPTVTGTGGVVALRDTNAPAGLSRFYRVSSRY